MRKELGFTLIELLASMTIVSVLAATSLQSFNILRKSAYDAARDQLIHNAQVALEAGRSNHENSKDEWFWITSNAQGALSGWRVGMNGGGPLTGSDLVPGLRLRKDTRVTVSMNTWCNGGNIGAWCRPSDFCCITDTIQAYHCKGNKVRTIHRWNNGETWEMEWDNGGC